MTTSTALFADAGSLTQENAPWPAIVISRSDIEREVERLASIDRPENGHRASRVVHPFAGRGEGLAPGIDVTVNVLKPDEESPPVRHNASQVNFVLQGGGTARPCCTDPTSGAWNRPGVGGSPDLTPDIHLAVQAEPGPPSPHSQAEAQGHELGGV